MPGKTVPKIEMMERIESVTNESESKQFKRLYDLPKVETILQQERHPLDGDPMILLWANQAFQFSCMPKARFQKIAFTSLCPCSYYPFCKDVERFENLVKVNFVFFTLDDHTECDWGDGQDQSDKSEEIWQRALLALDKIEDPSRMISMKNWKPYNLFWYAIFDDIFSHMSEVTRTRFWNTLREYCNGCITESKRIHFTSVEDVFQVRLHSIAANAFFVLIEYAYEISLSDEEWNDPLVQHLLLMAAKAMIAANDMSSFEKEWIEQGEQLERMTNTVAWTAILEECSVEEAHQRIAAYNLKCEQSMLEDMELLRGRGVSKDVDRFITGVEYLVGGNCLYGNLTDRYNKLYE